MLAAMFLGIGLAAAGACGPSAATAAAQANATSLAALVWSPFRRIETGWTVYAPRIAHDLGTACAPATPGFATALAGWQALHHLPPSGVFDAASFAVLKANWNAARPFVARMQTGCPPPMPIAGLQQTTVAEGYGGKQVLLRPAALMALRKLVASAQAAPGVAAERRAFKLFSGFREPVGDAARCVAEGNCNGIVRANCSAHRTGLAMDFWVGQAPGFRPDDSADVNRAAMVQTASYRWLLGHAAQFGFVNYVFEPWHWEWTGEPVDPPGLIPLAR